MCPYSELFWSAFSRIGTEYGEILCISPYSVRMRENADWNNTEYGHFSRSDILKLKKNKNIEGQLLTYFRRLSKIYEKLLLADLLITQIEQKLTDKNQRFLYIHSEGGV